MSQFPTAKDVLEGAAQHIETKGWCQGQLQNMDGQVCLMGALIQGADRVKCPGFFEAVSLVQDQIADGLVANWNDFVAQSAEDVLLVLKQAAAHAA